MGNTPHTSKNNFFESKFDAFNDTKKDGIHVETIQLYSSPEGGKKGWMVAITSFLVNGIIFGTINSFGIIFPELRTVHKDKIEVSARVSFVGSLAFGVTFIFIPVSGMLMDKLGLRVCTFIGACIAFFGMIMASLVFHKLELLYLSSLLFGVGSSMVFVPSMAILPQYFQDQLSMVNSFVSCGNCVFTIMIPHILRSILDTFQLKGAYYFLCGMTSLLIIPSITFSQILKTKVKKKSCLNAFKSHFNLSLLKNKIYIAWTIGFCITLLGYLIPYVYLPIYIEKLDLEIHKDYDGAVLITTVALASGVGRILFCKIYNLRFLTSYKMLMTSFLVIGSSLFVMPYTSIFFGYQIYVVILLCLLIGLFDGCLISLLSPIAGNFCSKTEKSQLVGIMVVILAIPAILGPPLAGILYDHQYNYKWTFQLAGIPMLIGTLFLFVLMKWVQLRNKNKMANEIQQFE